jgi:hypothetical protein
MTTALSTKSVTKGKGGRPSKAVKRNKLIGVKCSIIEKKLIGIKAKNSGLTVSEFLRELGLSGKIDMRKMALSKEILSFVGTLHHLAANINQIAKKRNQNEELNSIERARLQQDCLAVKQLASDIKNCFK